MEQIQYHEIEARKEFGLELIYDMGDLALQMARMEDIGMRIKPDGSKVTQIDLEINDQIITYFGDRFPDDLVWGEEGANSPIDRALSQKAWTWVDDPIDSTGNLVKTHEKVLAGELPDFQSCRSTILLSGFAPGDNAPSVSLIHSPFLPGRPTLYATPEGAWLADTTGIRSLHLERSPRRTSEVEQFESVSWRQTRPNFRDFLESMLPGKRADRRLSMGAVALGVVHFSVFPGPQANPHDVAAGAHIGHMAGAAVRSLAGEQYNQVDWLHGPIDGVVVAASGELANDLTQWYAELRAA